VDLKQSILARGEKRKKFINACETQAFVRVCALTTSFSLFSSLSILSNLIGWWKRTRRKIALFIPIATKIILVAVFVYISWYKSGYNSLIKILFSRTITLPPLYNKACSQASFIAFLLTFFATFLPKLIFCYYLYIVRGFYFFLLLFSIY